MASKDRNTENPSSSDGPLANASGFEAGASGNTIPAISLPKGGGAIRGMGEKFAANPITGTGSMTVPLAASPAGQVLDRNCRSLTTLAQAMVHLDLVGAFHSICHPQDRQRVTAIL